MKARLENGAAHDDSMRSFRASRLMSSDLVAKPTSRLSGIDLLRLGAMCLVTLQHALSLTQHDDWSSYFSMNVGQLGVAIFLAISALLAGSARRPPIRWLLQRIGRLYPAYWLAMIACFAATWITRYRQFDAYQFVSQMLGTGLFTHPGNLVNVPT